MIATVLTLASLVRVDAASAAMLIDCRLVMDGSSSPPGDRIDCTVRIAPQERDARLEVRAYVVSSETDAPPAPVRAGRRLNRDEAGNLLVNLDVAPDKPEPAVVVPYLDLQLPTGSHRLAYVVTLRVGDRVVGVFPLPVTTVRVGERSRHELRPREVGNAPEPVGAADVKASMTEVAGELGHRGIELGEIPRPRTEAVRSTTGVQGGFDRSLIEAAPEKNAELTGLSGQPWQPLSSVAGHEQRQVYFATNRAEAVAQTTKNVASRITFDNTVSETLTLGVCTVNFPVRAHKKGDLTVANWWQAADPDKYFLIDAIDKLQAADLLGEFEEEDVLLYVHGFNTPFDYAVLRAGQLQYDADFPGRAIAFSWPSQGSMSEYKTDVANAESSVRALADLIEMIARPKASADGAKAGKLHVIAHSLGNRLFLGALHDLATRDVWKPEEKYLGQVVLAAPDVGAARFNNVLGYAIAAADQVTYYYCRTDFALVASQQTNFYEPVGLYPYFSPGLDTINADGVGTGFLSHSYYGSSPKVLADLNLLLCSFYEPPQRMPPLAVHNRVYGHDHWSFLPVQIKEQ
jgi:esterase/lipase superfamily enzyme